MKISGLTVFICALAVCMIIITAGLARRDPLMKTTVKWLKYRDDMAKEQAKWPQAVARVQNATKMAQKAIDDWTAIAATRTLPPPPDPFGIDLSKDQETLITDMPDFHIKLQQAVNHQVKEGGVTVITGPRVPAPPTDPDRVLLGYFNFPAQPPVLVFNLGQVTVKGTFQQISDNINAWSRMPHFLAVADGLRLQGTSPNLIGTYTVSIVGFVQVPTDHAIFPLIPPGGRKVANPATPAAIGKEIGTAAQTAVGGGKGAAGKAPAGKSPAANQPPVKPPVRKPAGNAAPN